MADGSSYDSDNSVCKTGCYNKVVYAVLILYAILWKSRFLCPFVQEQILLACADILAHTTGDT